MAIDAAISAATSTTPTSTAKLFRNIVPSDTTEYQADLKGLYCQTGGDAVCVDWEGNVVTFAVTAGQILYIRPKRILAATTASLVGLWT